MMRMFLLFLVLLTIRQLLEDSKAIVRDEDADQGIINEFIANPDLKETLLENFGWDLSQSFQQEKVSSINSV